MRIFSFLGILSYGYPAVMVWLSYGNGYYFANKEGLSGLISGCADALFFDMSSCGKFGEICKYQIFFVPLQTKREIEPTD